MATDDFVLTPEEIAARKRKRQLMAIVALSILALIGIGVVLTPSIVRANRGRQSRKHAGRAFALIDQQKWREARDEATAAYQLRPSEPLAMRAVARLLSRVGQGEALAFWKNLAAAVPLTREDYRDECDIALRTNDLAMANDAAEHLLQNVDGKRAAADLILATEVAVQKRQFDKATELAEKVFTDPNATKRDELRANIALGDTLLNSGGLSATEALKIDKRLVDIANGDDQVPLDALTALTERFLSAQGEERNAFPIPVEELVKKIDHHPLAKPAEKLLTADLEISLHPDQREQIEQRTIDRWKNGSNEELTALGAWLYRRGDYQREIDAIPLDRAIQTRELFLQHVDALGALNRWDEIRRILENERYPLDPVMQHMYLARCFAQQGEQQGADNNWQRAIEDAAGDSSKLVMLGDYAEKNGALEVATTAFNAAAAVQPRSRPAQVGRLRCVYATGDTKRVREVLVELLKIWPNDTGLQNDEAYTHLLLLLPDIKPDSPELQSIETLAQKLVQDEPASLPHLTLLALTMLKQNRPYSALALYRGLTVPHSAVSASSVAVHAAVLAASGQPEPAKTEAGTIPIEKLLPEERELIKTL